MKFGFDIDDTLINLREYAFHIYNEKLQKKVPIDVFHRLERVEIHEPFGLTEEQGKRMWNSSLEDIYFNSCPPFPNAVATLQKLQNKGHEIYYITSRPKNHGERTMEWMKKQGFPIEEERFFYGMKDHEKIQFIEKIELDYYFDDKPEVLNTLGDKGKTTVIVKDQSYNRHLEFPRILEWTDIENLIDTEELY